MEMIARWANLVLSVYKFTKVVNSLDLVQQAKE